MGEHSSELDGDRGDHPEEYKPQPPSVIEVLVFLVCSMIVVGFIGVVVWMFVSAG